MTAIKENEERENHLRDEIVVDCYNEEEQAMGWHCYLEDHLRTPFQALCTAARRISPLQAGEAVTVTGMAPEDDCRHEMFVMIRWQERTLGVPLAQLEGIDVDEETAQALAGWHYWMARGYDL